MSIQSAREQVEAARLIKVREISDRIVVVLAEEAADVAIIAILDAGARILGVAHGMNAARACKEIARLALSIGRAEAGQ